MSHMSGLLREQPVPESCQRPWPQFSGPDIDCYIDNYGPPDISDLLRSISERHLIMPPNKMPSYSNVGFSLLGEALRAAVAKLEGKSASKSYEALVKRDIFDRLGMTGSSFAIDKSNLEHVVVPSLMPFQV